MILTLTCVGVAFLLGLLFGAGIYEAGSRPQRQKLEELIGQVGELADAIYANTTNTTDIPAEPHAPDLEVSSADFMRHVAEQMNRPRN